MNCTDFVHRYSDYDDSLLDPAELELFRTHLGGCSRCARYDRVLRKGRMLARQLPQPQPSDDFTPRLQQRLHQLRRERSRRSATPVLGGAAAALAAVTVMVTALWTVSLLDPTAWDETVAGAGPAADAGAASGAMATHEPSAHEPSATWMPTTRTASTRTAPASHAGVMGGWAALPAAEVSRAAGWAPARVDHYVPVAYSPLITGPPAYRVAGAFQTNVSTTTSHPPD